MDFSWTITDQNHSSPTEVPDDFPGYFTDIRQAARRSLPKNPTKDLCHLLGIHLVPAKLGSRASVYAVKNVEDRLLHGAPDIIQTAHRPPDVPVQHRSFLDRTISALPCSGYLEGRPKQERTIMGVAIYLAIIIIILLIIIIILAATLSSAAAGDGFGDRVIIGTQGESKTTSSSPFTSTTTRTTSLISLAATTSTSSLTPSTLDSTAQTSLSSQTSSSSFTTHRTSEHSDTTALSTSTSTESITSTKSGQKLSSLSTIDTKTSSSSVSALTTLSINVSSVSTIFPNVTTSYRTVGSTITPGLLPRLPAQKVSENCTTSECNAARVAINRVDFSISPCADLYQFACGDWIRSKQELMFDSESRDIPMTVQEEYRHKLLLQVIDILSEDYTKDDSFAERISKRVYQACLESNNIQNEKVVIQQLHSLVDPLGMFVDGYIANTIPNLLANVKRRFDHTPFFNTNVYPVETGSGQSVFGLKVSPPNMYLDRPIYSVPLESNQTASSFVSAGANILHIYTSSFDSGRGMAYRQAYDRMVTVFSIEGKIAKILNDVELDVTQPEVIHQTNITRLLDTYPFTPWDTALDIYNNSTNILIVNPEYFRKLDDLLRQLDDQDVMMYIFMSTLINRVWPYMPLSFRNVFQNVTQNSDTSYANFDCVEFALYLAKEEIHTLYIDKYTTTVLSDRLSLTNLVDDIMIVFKEIIKYPIWFTQDVRRVLKVLQRSMRIQFSMVKSQLVSSGKIDTSNQSFLILANELSMQKYAIKMDSLGANATVGNILDWSSMDVIYDRFSNTLGIPTALGAYFEEGSEPSFVLLGQVGQALSEGIIKMLTGSLPGGVAPSWWGTLNILLFENVTSCFVDQQTPLQALRNDLGNIIIANGAFQLTREVYNSSGSLSPDIIPGTSMTHDQMFYLHSVQMHCNSADSRSEAVQLLKERMNNVMLNQGNMKNHFSCPASSPMVTDDPCIVLQDESYVVV